MKEQIEARLRTLQGEYRRGQQQLTHLAQQQRELEETMLRISGAIQVLEELTSTNEATPPEAATVAANGRSVGGL
jgi:hypothetical protein